MFWEYVGRRYKFSIELNTILIIFEQSRSYKGTWVGRADPANPENSRQLQHKVKYNKDRNQSGFVLRRLWYDMPILSKRHLYERVSWGSCGKSCKNKKVFVRWTSNILRYTQFSGLFWSEYPFVSQIKVLCTYQLYTRQG